MYFSLFLFTPKISLQLFSFKNLDVAPTLSILSFFSRGFPLKNKRGMNEIRAETMSMLDFQFDQAIRHSLIHAQINIQCVACPKPICCQSKFDTCSIQKMGVDFGWMLYFLCVASYIRYFTWFDWNYTEFSFQWLFIFVF